MYRNLEKLVLIFTLSFREVHKNKKPNRKKSNCVFH